MCVNFFHLNNRMNLRVVLGLIFLLTFSLAILHMAYQTIPEKHAGSVEYKKEDDSKKIVTGPVSPVYGYLSPGN